jgi:LacI family transcriptional regulator
MATIKDVAKLAGVSVSTVSYALNGSTKVSLETKRKVEEAARKLNYQKNGFASDLKKAKTDTLALILSDLSGPFYSELIKGVQKVSMVNGYDLIACSSIGGPNSTALKFLKEKRVDGAIVLANNISDEIIVESARERFPIVLLDRHLDGDFVINVEVDNYHGGFLATEYLIKNGHREIAYISGPPDSRDSDLRFEGYKKALRDNGLSYQSKWNISGDFTREGGYHATKMLIMQGNLPSAIFYANDEMAIGGLQVFEENGIKVPDEISVIGFDDIQLAQYVNPPLTTIRQPKYEMGALAVHLMFQVLNGQEVEKNYKLSTELVERQSVKKREYRNHLPRGDLQN